ncbi:hypothetical protein Nepgr_032710 [Nepenthes gracilis]|uniref:DUF3741 domain-containing protein n=1 Tax=Nepenthes gracilis TaxID=150966 RepID=A0AAD3Y5Z3_NEPGR|nr:hypothetical protein Nepgr_032710 [Nepenthes gracilis]
MKKLGDLLVIACIPLAINQVECHPSWQQSKLHEFCKANGVHFSSYSPFSSPGTTWLMGNAWGCGKQLKHYPTFGKNGTTIAIQSFVFVMAKEGNQDGCGNLEEWDPTFRLATPNKLGVRGPGRPTIQLCPPYTNVADSSYEVGVLVYAWWSDKWWKGIIAGVSNGVIDCMQKVFPSPLLLSHALMKDLSFIFLKTTMGAKMRKGFRNFCNGDTSTSTLNQLHAGGCMINESTSIASSFGVANINNADAPRKSVTLEEMILQLEREEEVARRAKLNSHGYNRRMSCVNNSDILRSARSALNQYPRFSLDGRDSMYRSSFRNSSASRNGDLDLKLGGLLQLPQSLGGESVVWCKPGVVAKLMGLEAMPVPISRANKQSKEKLSSIIRNQSLRRRAERHKLEKRRQFMDLSGRGTNKKGAMCSYSKIP